MSAVINILCFIVSFVLVWIFLRDRLGIKQLGVICFSFGLYSLLNYGLAKYFNIGISIIPTIPDLNDPENAANVSLSMLKTAIVFFPFCYAFEWWYYRKHPDIDPYTGKKKEVADDDKA